jgi:hypothetical protein
VAKVLRINKRVIGDLQAATAYYDGKSIRIGNRFRAAIREGFGRIKQISDAMPHVVAGQPYRFHRLHRFPYVVVFHADGPVAHILGIFHSASDPTNWLKRASETDP